MYDFTTLVDRRNTGSSKWKAMTDLKSDVPEEIIPFSVADMELKNPPEIIDGLKERLDELILGYATSTDGYLEAICGWMRRRHGWDVSPEWIVPCNGVIPALYNTVKAFTEPGDGVLMLTPVYYPFFNAVEKNGRRVVGCDLVDEGERYVIDYDAFEKLARDPKNKLLIFCSPHNPVGRVWDRDELERIGRICLENGVQILSDEIHFDLIMPGHRHTVFATVNQELADNVIICTAPSKTFNLAGMHASNIIIKNKEIRQRFSDMLVQSGFFSLNALGYVTCELAYTRCEKWLDELLVFLDGNRRFVENYMKTNIPKIKVYPLEGTYLQWWDCKELGMDHNQLEQFMVHDALLFLDEGYIFGKSGEGFERINLACPTASLEQALDRLKSALGEKGLV